MADDKAFAPRPGFVPVLRREEISLIACIKGFDAGSEHVYIVDDNDRYTGKIITKEAFLTGWQTGRIVLRNLGALPRELAGDPEAMGRVLNEVLDGFPGCREIPMTSAGCIDLVATNEEARPASFELEWDGYVGFISAVFRDYKKVFVSSLENEDLRNFFYAAVPYCGRKLMPLRRENLQEALSEGNLLVFATDVYPPGSKCHFLQVYQRLHELAMKDMEGRINISRRVPGIRKKDLRKPSELIKFFDEGDKTVVVEDAEGNCCGVVMEPHFAPKFPGRDYPMWGNLMIPYDEDEERLKHTVAASLAGTARPAVPLIKDGKAVAMATLENVTYRDMTERELKRVQGVHWEYLSRETVKDFFADKPNVLISSLTGNLKSFYEKFRSILNITVYRDDCLEDFLAGDYDILLYEADVWGKCRSAKLNIEELYLVLVKREIGKLNISSKA